MYILIFGKILSKSRRDPLRGVAMAILNFVEFTEGGTLGTFDGEQKEVEITKSGL